MVKRIYGIVSVALIVFVPSGGKGEDEIIAEAEAMKNYLVIMFLEVV